MSLTTVNGSTIKSYPISRVFSEQTRKPLEHHFSHRTALAFQKLHSIIVDSNTRLKQYLLALHPSAILKRRARRSLQERALCLLVTDRIRSHSFRSRLVYPHAPSEQHRGQNLHSKQLHVIWNNVGIAWNLKNCLAVTIQIYEMIWKLIMFGLRYGI